MKTTVKQFAGDDEQIFAAVGPYAMNTKILTEFDRYPILTSENHVWYLAYNGKSLVGFASIKIMNNETVDFVNDYVVSENRKQGIHSFLLDKRLEWCSKKGIKTIVAECTKLSLNNYLKAGFTKVKEFSKWTKVEKVL